MLSVVIMYFAAPSLFFSSFSLSASSSALLPFSILLHVRVFTVTVSITLALPLLLPLPLPLPQPLSLLPLASIVVFVNVSRTSATAATAAATTQVAQANILVTFTLCLSLSFSIFLCLVFSCRVVCRFSLIVAVAVLGAAVAAAVDVRGVVAFLAKMVFNPNCSIFTRCTQIRLADESYRVAYHISPPPWCPLACQPTSLSYTSPLSFCCPPAVN